MGITRTRGCSVCTVIIFLIVLVGGLRGATSTPLHSHVRLKPTQSSTNEGMLQVYHNKFWGYVCFDHWNSNDADVACRHLGYAATQGYHAMATTEDRRRRYQGIYLQSVECDGSEESLWDCENANVGIYDETCESSQVVWLECTNNEDDTTGIPTTAVATTEIPAVPAVEVVIVTHSSVSLDWREWFTYAQRYHIDDPVVRFDVMYRPVGDPSVNFTLGREVFGYFKSGTVEYLQPRTTYEFKVQVIRLDPSYAGESVATESPSVNARTPCKGPLPVKEASVESVMPRQVKIRWSTVIDGDCPPEAIIIEYKLLSREQCREKVGDELDGALRIRGNHSIHLNHLHPYSTYAVNVTVFNQYGYSSEVALLVNTTQSEPLGTPRDISTDYHSGSPGYDRAGPKTLTATWNDPLCGEMNGIINGYTYMLLDVQTDRVISSGSTEVPIVHLPNVDPLNRYKFLVAARTVAGMGPYGAASVAWQYDIADICGQSNPRMMMTRVAGGEVSTKGEFPWMAQIWHIKYGRKFCAGSILDDHWIITAAHCIKRYNITQEDVRVQLGDYDTLLPEPQQRVYDVDRIHVHVGFNEDVFDDDIALIHVREPIEFSDHIKPICLPDKKIARKLLRPGDDKYGTVAGWGRDKAGKLPRFLKQVSLPIADRSDCKRATNYTFTPNMFCAGYEQEGGGDACEGDSGGPFMVRRNNRYFITGLVSWGHPLGCDKRNQFGYYTRIFKYMGWIKNAHPSVNIVRHTSGV